MKTVKRISSAVAIAFTIVCLDYYAAVAQSRPPNIVVPVEQITVADRLKGAGYQTALVGKWHLGFERRFWPTERGFDEFFGFLGGSHKYNDPTPEVNPLFDINKDGAKTVQEVSYLTDAFAERAIDFIKRQKSKPFFLYVAFNAVHEPTEPSERSLARFRHIADERRRNYAAVLSSMDDAIGRIVAALRVENMEDNTLLIFFNDNGGPLPPSWWNGASNAPLRGRKGQTWEGSIRVPFIIQWKGHLPAGKTYSEPMIQLDVLPTALAAAGIKVQTEWKLDGVILLPFLTGKARGSPHEMLYWRTGGLMAIRKGDWKLVKMSDSGGQEDPAVLSNLSGVELYNLKDDIGETKDLAAKYPKKVEELKEAWLQWHKQLAKPAWPPVAAGQRDQSEATLVLLITAASGIDTPFAGEWEANIPFPPSRSLSFEFKTDGTSVTGVIRRLPGTAPPLPIFDGKIDRRTMTFKVKSPDGQRTIKFEGTLTGEEIVFFRRVEEQESSARPSTGFFGSTSRQTFTAKRRTKQPEDK
jgi:arylsulfatase A-like enzyme